MGLKTYKLMVLDPLGENMFMAAPAKEAKAPFLGGTFISFLAFSFF